VIVRKRLHSLLYKLVALIFEALAIAELARVDTTTVIVILGRRRGRPIPVGRDNIVDLQLLGDLLNAHMQRVRVELLSSHVRVDGSGQAHQTSRLVVAGITPSVALLAARRTVGIFANVRVRVIVTVRRLTASRAATALQVEASGRLSGVVAPIVAIAADATTVT
jgi:hypothetical protein